MNRKTGFFAGLAVAGLLTGAMSASAQVDLLDNSFTQTFGGGTVTMVNSELKYVAGTLFDTQGGFGIINNRYLEFSGQSDIAFADSSVTGTFWTSQTIDFSRTDQGLKDEMFMRWNGAWNTFHAIKNPPFGDPDTGVELRNNTPGGAWAPTGNRPGSAIHHLVSKWTFDADAGGYVLGEVWLNPNPDLTAWDDYYSNAGLTTTPVNFMTIRQNQSSTNTAVGQFLVAGSYAEIAPKAFIAGDINRNFEVNSADIAAIIQAGTFNTGVPATWSTGDFTGDGVVTSADIAAIIQAGQFNAGPYAALNTDNSNLVDPVGELPYLEIDLDGSAVMTTNMVGNQGFQIISPAGTLTGTATIPPGFFLTNDAEEASILFQQVPDVLDLGMLVADLDGFIADLAAGNVTFHVANATATGFVEGNVFVVPEPASLALLGLGGLALLRRRSA